MGALRESPEGIQKQCSKCQEWHFLPGGFSLDMSASDGFVGRCKKCESARSKVRYANMSQDEKKQAMKRWSERQTRANYLSGRAWDFFAKER